MAVGAEAIPGCSLPCNLCQRLLRRRSNSEDLHLDLAALWRDIQEAVLVPVIAAGRPLDDFGGLVDELLLYLVCSCSRLARRHLDGGSGKQ